MLVLSLSYPDYYLLTQDILLSENNESTSCGIQCYDVYIHSISYYSRVPRYLGRPWSFSPTHILSYLVANRYPGSWSPFLETPIESVRPTSDLPNITYLQPRV